MRKRVFLAVTAMFCISVFISSCSKDSDVANQQVFSIAVFVPGQVEGSPTYEMLVSGVETAVLQAENSGRQVETKIFEAGYNQSEWGDKLQALAATGSYDLIVSTNPSIPDLIVPIHQIFPEQKFVVLDGGNPGIETLTSVTFNQYEQGYLSGFFAGLVTSSKELSGSNDQLVAGLVAGQEYPVMNDEILPGFQDGLKASAGETAQVDFRVLGNWYDAEKARELADSIIRQGGDVILSIAGSGSQGVLAAAKSAGTYVLWFDSPGYEYGPGTVLGSSMVRIDTFTRDIVSQAIDGSLEYGDQMVLGIQEGAIDYARNDPAYVDNVPADIRRQMNELIDSILSGEVVIGR